MVDSLGVVEVGDKADPVLFLQSNEQVADGRGAFETEGDSGKVRLQKPPVKRIPLIASSDPEPFQKPFKADGGRNFFSRLVSEDPNRFGRFDEVAVKIFIGNRRRMLREAFVKKRAGRPDLFSLNSGERHPVVPKGHDRIAKVEQEGLILFQSSSPWEA